MGERDITKKMLNTIRNGVEKAKNVHPLVNEEKKEYDNFLTRAEILMEEAEKKSEKKTLNEDVYSAQQNGGDDDFVISPKDTQFANLRNSEEESLRKTVGDVELKDDALVYHPDIDDITMDGIIKGLNIKFEFRYNDPTSCGCYVSAANLQLTDDNIKVIQKLRAGLSKIGKTVLQMMQIHFTIWKLLQRERKKKTINNYNIEL